MNGYKQVWAAVGLVLAPFGSVTELISHQNPWRGFHADGPVLTVARIQKFQVESCQDGVRTLLAQGSGASFVLPDQDSKWDLVWKAWEPLVKEDLENITDCDKFPCAVKFNRSEVSKMKAVDSSLRLKEFRQLVQDRCLSYKKTQERKAYEFPGDPVDPWAYLEKQGFVTSLKRPSEPSFWSRKLDLSPGQLKNVHQLLDRRVAQSSSGLEAVVWVRDVYTDHYFESWGEWTQLTCSGNSNKEALLVQVLLIELDQLKATDLVSKIMRGKMKSEMEKNGGVYLDQGAERIRLKSKVSKARSEKAESTQLHP